MQGPRDESDQVRLMLREGGRLFRVAMRSCCLIGFGLARVEVLLGMTEGEGIVTREHGAERQVSASELWFVLSHPSRKNKNTARVRHRSCG